MDVQTVLDTALAANATSLASADSGQIFRKQLKSTLSVSVNLLPKQKDLIRKSLNFPVVFVGGKNVTNDHPVLVAFRDIVRDSYEQQFGICNIAERALVVGAAAREIQMYNFNPHIHYYVHGKEGKDYDRIIRPAMQEINKTLKQKAKKTDKRIFLTPGNECRMRPVVKRYWDFQEIYNDYMELKKMPKTIHTDYVKCNTLLFEDSHYNFGVDDWFNAFDKTGAMVAYGYGLLPLELIFPDLPENPLYSITRQKVNCSPNYVSDDQKKYWYQEKFCLVFRQGYCNGYAHDIDKWATLLKSPVMQKKGKSYSLLVEITSRAGPAVVFKVIKMKCNESIVRSIELPQQDAYVKVLDVKSCVNINTGRVSSPLVYFSVREDEYLDVYNYALSLPEKSMNFQNIVAYIRRRMGGMSLITKELVEAWYLPKRKVEALAINVYLEVSMRNEMREKIFSNIDVTGIYEKFKSFFRKTARIVFFPIAILIDWIYASNLVDKLVLYPSGISYQFVDVNDSGIEAGLMVPLNLYVDHPFEGDIPSCSTCFELDGKMGEQIIQCEDKLQSSHIFHLTDEELNKMKGDLVNNDEDPIGFREVKEKCRKNLPANSFSRTCKINYIAAGPGCGKSYMIRQMATPHDLVLAPFSKLMPDYTNLKNQEGENYNLLFKTTHRAMETRGCRRIFVDEFTSMPYEYLACIAEVNGAEEVFLVGDERQTKVQEPDEGYYIGNRINLDEVAKHTLRVNFRNPRDTVALLNRTYGYQMIAKSKIEKSMEVVPMEGFEAAGKLRMCFSTNSAETITENRKNTVRANQGGTTKQAALYVVCTDANLPSVEELQIVGLSRHTEKLYIVHDGSEQFEVLSNKLKLDTDFYEHMNTWLTFPNEPLIVFEKEDPSVAIVVPDVHPPADMHYMVETFIPSAALCDIQTSMNHEASALVPSDFNTGKFNPDFIIMPRNKRGHPQTTKVEYYAISSGVGNHFSAKSPVQTLQVLQARYFCKQPFFRFGYSEELLVKDIVDCWFSSNVKPNATQYLFQDDQIQEIINDFIHHVSAKHYQDSFGGLENGDARVIRFNLKEIFKPKHGFPDVYKAGQGISAWSTDACAMFCSVFRVLNKMVLLTEKDNVITDSYMDEVSFINKTIEEFGKVSNLCMNATTDGVTFDASQNKFTQMIEKEYWRRLGVDQSFLDHYYSFRSKYRVISNVAIGEAGTQKTSGEPGTLANNGIVSKTLSNYIIDRKGAYVINYKGDDFNLHGLDLEINKQRQTAINACCALQLKVSISYSAEFCGLMFCHGMLYPSIPRRMNKVAAHRFRTYEHFCEYQASLRDWTKALLRYNEMHVVGNNAQHYNTSVDEMQSCLDTLKSLSHINKEQFYETFKKREEESIIPIGIEAGKFLYIS